MTTLAIAIFTLFYGFCVGGVLAEVENEAIEYERSRTEVFKEDIDSKLGRLFYFPVEVYARIADHLDKKTEERASE